MPAKSKIAEASSSPVKPPKSALPTGSTANSAARPAVSPSSPPKADARKRPLAKLGSSPAKSTVGTIAPIEKEVILEPGVTPDRKHGEDSWWLIALPQTQPVAEALVSPFDTDAVASETEDTAVPTMAESQLSEAPGPTVTLERRDTAATSVVVAEEVAPTPLCGDGSVRLIYQQYGELFPIAGGSTTQAAVDEVYCLSFVMPNCRLHLARYEDAERFARLERGETHESVFVREQPLGTFLGLEAGQAYFVVVEQEAEQLERDQQATRELWAPERAKEKLERDDGRGFESCSCIYGNPCMDEYGCRDWHARFAVAAANGWKGF